jgi:hypothetical protein
VGIDQCLDNLDVRERIGLNEDSGLGSGQFFDDGLRTAAPWREENLNGRQGLGLLGNGLKNAIVLGLPSAFTFVSLNQTYNCRIFFPVYFHCPKIDDVY